MKRADLLRLSLWIVLVAFVLSLAVWIWLRQSAIYSSAEAWVRNSCEVEAITGKPIETSLSIGRFGVHTTSDVTIVRFGIVARGPKTAGTIYLDIDDALGSWTVREARIVNKADMSRVYLRQVPQS